MAGSRRQYPFHLIEPKWQQTWEQQQAFRAFNPGESVPDGHPFGVRHNLSGKTASAEALPPKFYILDMFPYPSGAGLHVGHPEGYTATDILARYRRACGFNVLHPMGWDSFGLPAEQYAVKTGQHPRKTTEENIANFTRQIKSLGFSYDWTRELATTDPDYFKWTQWIFLKLYNSWFNPETNKAEPIETLKYPEELQLADDKVGRVTPCAPSSVATERRARSDAPYHADLEAARRAYRDSKRLAYVSEAPVNWCPELGTVLANEEVIDGKSEVGGFPVIRKPMRQWMLRITAYAEKLLADLDTIDWSDSLKEMQRNWIGRSEGAEVDFQLSDCGLPVANLENRIRVFTTRPNTLFGATYMVLAPEHKLVNEIFERANYWQHFEARINREITATHVCVIGADGSHQLMPLESALGLASKEFKDLIEVEGSVSPPICRLGNYEMFKMTLVQRAREILSQRKAVEVYQAEVAKKSDLERTELAKEKSGVFTGAYAVNPVHGGMIPIWIADYVLASYGTGAIMAVPGHDTRDFEFATKYNLPVIQVVQPPDTKTDWRGFTDEGIATNSANFEIGLDGLPTPEAKRKITAWLEAKGLGKKTINYKLRDWLFSRQRYWGEPFPIVWKKNAAGNLYHEALPESSLPLLPPSLEDYKPTPDGQPPLARAKDWLNLPDGSTRETNTMPQWAGSCWYYLRYLDAKNNTNFVGKDVEKYWMGSGVEALKRSNVKSSSVSTLQPFNASTRPGVDLYVGGTEHAVLHLLYARFWHKVLFDLGYVSTPEPFFKLVNQGLILGELEFTSFKNEAGQFVSADSVDAVDAGEEICAWDSKSNRGMKQFQVSESEVIAKGGKFFLKSDPNIRVDARSFKMSKSRGNVVNPDEIIQSYGADSLRLYEMFMGPLQETKPWNTKGVEGVYRFLGRVWRLFVDEQSETDFEQAETTAENAEKLKQLLGLIKLSAAIKDTPPTPAQLKTLHACIKKVTEDLDGMRFNTAISAMMVFVNDAMTWETKSVSVLRTFLQLLAPFAPHLAEELWDKLSAVSRQPSASLPYAPWPKFDPALLVESEIEIPVQVNGKLRDVIKVSITATAAELEALALKNEKVQQFIAGKTIKKVVVLPKRLVNIVVA